MNKITNFSASDLVKKSASQILYFISKKIEVQATYNQIKGNYHADEIVLKEEASAEKRGVVEVDNLLIFFCVDMVKDNKYVEIKMVDDMNDYPEWYLQSSIMQATFYASLLQDVDHLDTPKFRKKEGFKQEIIQVINPVFELWFGTDKYKIFPNNDIKNHYLNKASIINKCSIDKLDYSPCREFDGKFKFKEFSIFKPQFELIS